MIYIKFIKNQGNSNSLGSDIYSVRDDLLYSAFGVRNARRLIKKDKYGKPCIENANFDFSVSHTQDAGVVAVCGKGLRIEDCTCIDKDVNRIGVDIECADRQITDKSLNLIMNKYFTKQETEYVGYGKEGYKVRFLQIWTKKESIVKATGEGIKAIGKTDSVRLKFSDTRQIKADNKTFIITVSGI